jgi:type IV pilus assembly protein PilV
MQRKLIDQPLARKRPQYGNMRNQKHFFGRRCGGLTLIEVLVTLVVISVGLLGVAALQIRTLRHNYDALMRSHASALADDIADRMRANSAAVRPTGGQSKYETEYGPHSISSDASRATSDVIEWKQAITARLPSGDGEIVVAEDTGLVTIRVRWGERSDDPDAEKISFTTQTVI